VLERDALLATVHSMVPVKPFFGVIVTVDVPVLPAERVTLVAAIVKVSPDELDPPTVNTNVPVEAAKVESPE